MTMSLPIIAYTKDRETDMVAPIIAGAVAVAARLAAKKAAQAAAKKSMKAFEVKSAALIQKRSVQVVPGKGNVGEMTRKGLNKEADNTLARRKSGELAKTRAAEVNVGKPKTTVKINSVIKSKPRASRTRSGNKAK